jgi:hypothetical protein
MSNFESQYRTWHTYMSHIKSTIRIAGCCFVLSQVLFGDIVGWLAFSLIVAEIIGIIEECV